MSYSGLRAAQWISRTNLDDGITNNGLIRKNTFTVDSKWITKTELDNYLFIDTSDASYAAKGANQWITKNDLVNATCIRFTINGVYISSSVLEIQVTVVGTLPAAGDLYFEFCTDNGAQGNITFNFPSGGSGVYSSPQMDTTVTGTYITTAGSGVLNEFFVKPSTVNYTTADATRCYIADGANYSATCTGATSEDICLNCYCPTC